MNKCYDVAVVGLGGVLPGCGNLDGFWKLVENAESAVRHVPAGRWVLPVEQALSREKAPDKAASDMGCFVDTPDPSRLKAGAFSKETILSFDPLFLIAMAAGQDAFAEVNSSNISLDRAGVILGSIALPTETASRLACELAESADSVTVNPLNSFVNSFTAISLAKSLGFKGEAVTLDAACASSLYAIKLACDRLTCGEADLMLAGGVSRPDCMYTAIGFTQLSALSSDGICAPFDKKGKGLVIGEGAGIVALKRFDDALKDGDRIYGIIRAVGLSNDISGSLLSPSSEGQLRSMKKAYEQTGWSPWDVELFECHATGTPVGDRIEFDSLTALFNAYPSNKKRHVLSSSKSNIGHLLTGAGGAGILKALLSVNRGLLPPTANFEDPSVPLSCSPFEVLKKAEKWDSIHKKAAVSAFGFGGINAHLLVENYVPSERKIYSSVFLKPSVKVAVIGLALRTGGADNAYEFESARACGEEDGARFMNPTRIPYGSFRIPPNELKEALPQQKAMLFTAKEAVVDSGVSEDELKDGGVFIGISFDFSSTDFYVRWKTGSDRFAPPLNANRTMGSLGSITASRIAREFKCSNSSFTMSEAETGGLAAVSEAVRALSLGEISLAVAGSADMASDDRAAFAKRKIYSQKINFRDSAVAFVLKRFDDALKDGNKIYAVIDGAVVDNASLVPQSLEALSFGCCGGALELALQCLFLKDRYRFFGSYALRNRADEPLKTEVSAVNINGTSRKIFISEGAAKPEHIHRFQKKEIFFFSGYSESELKKKLQKAADFMENSAFSFSQAARLFYESEEIGSGDLRCAVVAESAAELRNLADLFPKTSSSIFIGKPDPSLKGKLAFVFPGSGNYYMGMGRELALRFPEVMNVQDRENMRLKDQILPDIFWSGMDAEAVADNHPALLQGQTAMSSIASDVLCFLGVKPDASIGYSLGEMAGVTALRVWKSRDKMREKMLSSSLFTSDLAGDFNAVKKTWGVSEKINWLIGVVAAPPDKIKSLLKDRKKVYLLIINTPEDCVIGGDKNEVLRLAKDLGCELLPIKGVTSVHCEVVKPVADKYRDLHFFPADNPEQISFYSSAWGSCFEPTSESIADAILAQASDTIDFPAVINRAYEDGVRIFIEVGPGKSCSRMINAILKNRPHLAVNMTREGESEITALITLCAELFVFGVNFNPEPLFDRRVPSLKSGMIVSLAPEPFLKRAEKFKLDAADRTDSVADKASRVRANYKEKLPLIASNNRDCPSPNLIKDQSADINVKRDLKTCNVDEPYVDTDALLRILTAQSRAHSEFLTLSFELTSSLLALSSLRPGILEQTFPEPLHISACEHIDSPSVAKTVFMDRESCMEFAVGSIGRVLGEKFAFIDSHPTRVRLPDEPLMLVDRIISVEGEPMSLTSGRVVTEHDVLPDRWYLDNGVIPTCIAVEAGQSDLFLSAWLGIDKITKGLAVYRLLDAKISFHGSLPSPGETIRYEINIERFFTQGSTWLFYFNFESFVSGRKLLSMTNGCAGFFTREQLDSGRGLIRTGLDLKPVAGVLKNGFEFPVEIIFEEAYGDAALNELRKGNPGGCFGELFENLPIKRVAALPSHKYMKLIDRVVSLSPCGGKYSLGSIVSELDIHPDDWFLVCHFSDDNVMPGTLMYECCMHTLRFFLMRAGFVGEASECRWEPVQGVSSSLKCRGQVTASTKKASFKISVKEIGYNPYPYALADALMYADDKPVVEMLNMSIQLTGSGKQKLEAIWHNVSAPFKAEIKKAAYDNESIMEFAAGKPSKAFGDKYKPFDEDRIIARLPRPPYKFLDRIVEVSGEKWVLTAPASAVAQYDISGDEWYFDESSLDSMPFSILLEVALQPCGWLAAYLGSALTSSEDLSFRNLGGEARVIRAATRNIKLLETKVVLDKVSQAAGMLIQNYSLKVFDERGLVYEGTTYFGFFSKEALKNQIGIRDLDIPSPGVSHGSVFKGPYPFGSPFPSKKLGMIDEISAFYPDGGPFGLGLIEGVLYVDPDSWFFKAHFYQDPVIPGSLGLESMISLMKYMAVYFAKGTSANISGFSSLLPMSSHKWTYRGQIIPSDSRVKVLVWVKSRFLEEGVLICDGILSVDGRNIYSMEGFSIKIKR